MRILDGKNVMAEPLERVAMRVTEWRNPFVTMT
jgi:hypothetical protein